MKSNCQFDSWPFLWPQILIHSSKWRMQDFFHIYALIWYTKLLIWTRFTNSIFIPKIWNIFGLLTLKREFMPRVLGVLPFDYYNVFKFLFCINLFLTCSIYHEPFSLDCGLFSIWSTIQLPSPWENILLSLPRVGHAPMLGLQHLSLKKKKG